MGKFRVNRYYGPVAQLRSDGAVDTLPERIDNLFKNKYYVMIMCTLRVPPNVLPTSGIVLKDKPEPTQLIQMRKDALVSRTGSPAEADRVIARLSKRSGIDENDERMGDLLEAKIFFDDIIGPGKKVPESRSVHLHQLDARFQTIAAFMPAFCGRAFQVPAYNQMIIASATLLYDYANGEPSRLYVSVKGPGSDVCHNRCCRNEQGHDDSTLSGTHTGWVGCVYFVVTREHRGRVTQLCSNTNERGSDTRRNVTYGRLTNTCKKWRGRTVKIEPPPITPNQVEVTANQAKDAATYAQFVRDMFYLPCEQTYEACVKTVIAQAQRLNRTFTKRKVRTPAMIGSHACYEDEVAKVLCKGKGNEPEARFSATMYADKLNLDTGTAPDDCE